MSNIKISQFIIPCRSYTHMVFIFSLQFAREKHSPIWRYKSLVFYGHFSAQSRANGSRDRQR